MKSSAIKTQNTQIPRGSLLDPRALPNMVNYFSADLDTAASGSDVSIKDFISGSSIAGGDSGNRGAALAATSGPTGKRVYDFDTGVYNLGNFATQRSNFVITMVNKVTDTTVNSEKFLLSKNVSGGFGLIDFTVKYKVNIDTGGSGSEDLQAKLTATLGGSISSPPQNTNVQSMLRSYHVMSLIQADGKMTIRFNGQQHTQATVSRMGNSNNLLVGDSAADGSSNAGVFDTPEFMIYTLSDPTSFSEVIAMENYLQKKYDIGFFPIS